MTFWPWRKESQGDRIEGKLDALKSVALAELARLHRKVSTLASAEQVQQLTGTIDSLESTLTDEIGQIQAKIDELIAGQGDEPDPALDAQIARLETMKNAVAAIIADSAPEP